MKKPNRMSFYDIGNPKTVTNNQELSCPNPGDFIKKVWIRSDSSYGISQFGITCNSDASTAPGGSQGMAGRPGNDVGSLHSGVCPGGVGPAFYATRAGPTDDPYLKWYTPICADGSLPQGLAPNCCGGSNIGPKTYITCGGVVDRVVVKSGPTKDRNPMVTQLDFYCKP